MDFTTVQVICGIAAVGCLVLYLMRRKKRKLAD